MQKESKLIFILILFTSSSFSQENTVQEVLKKTNSNQLLENVHLHLNKTAFTKGEHIWFTAYVQDQITQLPSLNTKNIHVGIYDRLGKELKRKLLLVENGIANGEFSIASTFVHEKYLVLGWTNYMRNFNKLPPFSQQITIIDEISNVNPTRPVGHIFKAYPEGGNLISGAFNNIGIRYADHNGSGIAISNIKLIDGEGNLIKSNIATNADGIGKVGFMAEKHQYFLEIEREDGKVEKVPISESETLDVGLSIDNLGKRQLIVKMVLSKETISTKEGRSYTLSIVQDNDIFIQDWKVGKDELAIAIERNLLPYGINTVILFDETLRPIARRMFYNHMESKERMAKLDIGYRMNVSRDSLQISFTTPDARTAGVNMSLLVLPSGTQAYNPRNSLSSSFLIGPYTNSNIGYINDLKDFDRYKNNVLDMKLLVEGWGRYDWETRVQEPNKIEFKIESGIMVQGKVSDANLEEENQAYFMTLESKAIQFEDLKRDKSFTTNMVLFQNDSLGVSLIGKKGILRKPKVDFQIGSKSTEHDYNILPFFNQVVDDSNEAYGYFEHDIALMTPDEGIIDLEEVVVSSKIIHNNKLEMNSAEVDGRFIGDLEIKKYHTVRSYLTKIGFFVGSGIVDGVGKTVVRSRKIGNPIVPISISGMGPGDGMALEMSLERVQAIFHDEDRKAWIIIVPREGIYTSPENRNKFIKQLIVNGYARPQEYFNPRYADYNSSMFVKFGVIYWQSNVVVNGKTPTTIQIPILNQKKLKLFIEGIGKDGTLISMEKEIDIDKNYKE